MRWTDRVYGDVAIDDPDLLDLIRCPTFQRLKGIRQAGPSAFAFPFKTVSRFEHSLGVYLLLVRLEAPRRECVAGLLHDISHTAFSHAVDFVFHSDEQDYHETLKPEFLKRPDIAPLLARMGYAPADFYDDSIYPRLERPLPALCADRLDYFFRDSLTCGVSSPEMVARGVASLTVVGDQIAFADAEIARETARRFALMNEKYWAGDVESFIYNEFADALREGLRIGALREQDLLSDDSHVMSRLRSSGDAGITRALDRIEHFRPEWLEGFVPKVSPKLRWLDPTVVAGGEAVRLSELDRVPPRPESTAP